MEFDTLVEYYSVAKKTISKLGRRYYPSLVKEMLNNEDAISTVASAIMTADWKWDANKKGKISGLSKTKYSFRNQYVIWALKDYISAKYNKNHKQEKLIEYTKNNKINEFSSDPADMYEEKEERAALINKINSCGMTTLQKNQLIEYYLNERTYEEIGLEYGVTREAVRLNVKKGLEKLKGLMNAV